jgi:hypothetical protein
VFSDAKVTRKTVVAVKPNFIERIPLIGKMLRKGPTPQEIEQEYLRKEVLCKVAAVNREISSLKNSTVMHGIKIRLCEENVSRLKSDRVPKLEFLKFALGDELFRKHLKAVEPLVRDISCVRRREVELRRQIALRVTRNPQEHQFVLDAAQKAITAHSEAIVSNHQKRRELLDSLR